MENRSLSVTFVGGARKVTGSNFLVEAAEGEKVTRILVDVGLEQGARFCESTNNDPFPYDPKTIDAVFITHAHADHVGLVPKLTKHGYTKKVYMTSATADLAEVMLEDSAGLMAREAKQCEDIAPYEKEDLENTLPLIAKTDYKEEVHVAPGIIATFFNAGHILGSVQVLLDVWGTKLLFSGDLGRQDPILVSPPEFPEEVDYYFTESVYGNRVHAEYEDSTHDLLKAIQYVIDNKGTLLIPSFSLERTQIILATIDNFLEGGLIPEIPVYLDSPLATRVTEVYTKYPELLRDSFREELERGDDPFSFKSLRVTYTHNESKNIPEGEAPKVIIAGAGMSHGGRVRSHEKEYLPDPSSMLLLTGYQVAGSLGRRLQDGASKVEIDRKEVKVRAAVRKTGGFSAHADRDDLVAYAEKVNPEKVFVVLGEMEVSSFLAQRISGFLGIETYIPQKGEKVELSLAAPVLDTASGRLPKS